MRPLLMILVMLAFLPSPAIYGQVNNYGWGTAPIPPWDRRAVREQAIAYAGPYCRLLVQSEFGDEAACALLRCSEYGASELVAFHASGGLGRMPRPRELLTVIAGPSGGDPVCLYAIRHAAELMDRDYCDAFLSAPRDFVSGRKELAAVAAEKRAQRLAAPWWESGLSAYGYDTRSVAWGTGFVVLALLLLWRRRRRLSRYQPA